MTPSIKQTFFHLFIISVALCASKSIDDSFANDLRVFFYGNSAPYFRYSNISSLHNSKVIWTNKTNIITMEYYPKEKTFFWTTKKGELYSTIWNEAEDMTFEELNRTDEEILRKKQNAKLLYRENDWYPRSLALDEVGEKLYIVDPIERSIDVFNLDGKNKAKIFTDEYVIPIEIVVDPWEGLLFFYAIEIHEMKTQIYRMNMDGSEPQLIIQQRNEKRSLHFSMPIAFAIDRVNKHLYYGKKDLGTVMVDYNGHSKVTIFNGDRVNKMEIYNNRLYWNLEIIKRYKFISSSEEYDNKENENEKNDLIIYSCDVSNKRHIYASDACLPKETNEAFKYTNFKSNEPSTPTWFKIVDLSPQKKIAHSCLENNGGCEDHCLLKPSGVNKPLSFGCACNVDRRLNQDKKTCIAIPAEDKLVKETEPFVYEKIWTWSYRSSIVQYSRNFVYKFLYDGPEIARDDELKVKYEVTTEGALVKCQNDNKCVILRNSTEKIAKFLTYDWVSKNLYFAKFCNNSEKHNLYVLTAKYPEKKIYLGEINAPTSMVVHPYSGYLFVATFDEKKRVSHIIRYNTNGKDRMVHPYVNKTNILLTLDMAQNDIYWIDGADDEPHRCLRRSDFDGNDIKLVAERMFQDKLESISIYDKDIFVKTYNDRIYTAETKGGDFRFFDNVKRIEDEFNESSIKTTTKVHKTNTQYYGLENPCVLKNGGCEMFCFAVPVDDSEEVQKICDCSDDKKLDSNGMHDY